MSDRGNGASPEAEQSRLGEAGEGKRLRGELLAQLFRSRILRQEAKRLAEALLALRRPAE